MERALITGGNRGIGYATAQGLLAREVDVVIGARDSEAGADAARSLGCEWVHLDLETPATFGPAVRQAAPRAPQEGADSASWLSLDAPAHLTGKFCRDREEKAW